MEIPVPLQPKTCKRCQIQRIKMDYSGKNHVCNPCLQQAKKDRKIKTNYPRWSRRVSEKPREVDRLFDEVTFTPDFLAARPQIRSRLNDRA